MKKVNLKIILKKIKHTFVNIGSDADKDWRIVFSLFIVSIVISIVWHINMYMNINIMNKTVPNSGAKSAINVHDLEEMISKYDGRAEEFKNIIESKKPLIDPAQ